ncbi:MAG: RsmB/NOP family class I SAM-dependent RNA methyltransferase [Bdellovibrionaceae bacterium]|jgi:16S rRNA (cytosine967-C5)-methyltransferase|nr:RsmB/NOP family class I SAM-dependent RNA methyltransferase [Pseudobdellovibrionaceae bacterium]
MTNKIHMPLLNGIVQALVFTFKENQHAEKALEKIFKSNRKLGGRDRRFIASNFYNIVRHWRRVLYVLGIQWKDNETLDLSENDYHKICAFWIYKEGHPLPGQFEDDEQRFEEMLAQYNSLDKSKLIKEKESTPNWLNEMGQKEFSDRWPQVVSAMNHQAPIYLRTNILKTTTDDLKNQMDSEEISTEKMVVDKDLSLLKVKIRKNVFQTQAFKKGHFEVQDGGSQQIAPFCQVAPKMKVVDACAGAGGKSLQLGTLMKNKGKLIALDIHEWKLNELKKRAARNNIDVIETHLANSKRIKKLKGMADRLLLDVPCSGLGVLKRSPDTKWKMSPARIEELKEIQKTILFDYSKMVKVGGKLIYATCSIFPDENERQVAKFLEANPDWTLEAEQTLLPSKQPFDGFYMARLIRNS